MRMAFAVGAVFFNLRCSLRKAASFTRVRFCPKSSSCFVKRSHCLSQIPKVTLLCWGAVNAASLTARCQEATLRPQTSDKKTIAKLQVHKLVFYIRLSLRALILLLKFGPLLLLSPLTLLSTYWASHWLDALLWVTETSGPTFIKLGQWASTRRDIFSQQFCERFSKLHIQVRPHSWPHTKQCLRRAFGDSWWDVLVFESKEPVGSGCIAQVYRGWAKADRVEDPTFKSLVEDMEKEDLLKAWEIPGFKVVASSFQQLWNGNKDKESCEEKSYKHGQYNASSREKEHLIPVAIKVSNASALEGPLNSAIAFK